MLATFIHTYSVHRTARFVRIDAIVRDIFHNWDVCIWPITIRPCEKEEEEQAAVTFDNYKDENVYSYGETWVARITI